MVSAKAVVVALVGATCAYAAYPTPGKCSGECYAHDPSVVQRESDGMYFKFTTREYLQYASSKSLEGPWDIVGDVLPQGSSLKAEYGADENVWAPDCSKVGDLYYCYYAISSFGSQHSAIGLATSETMDNGSWTDHGSVGISSNTGDQYNAIDPNLIQVQGQGDLLTFGSFYGDIYQVPMNKDPTKATSDAPYNIETNSTGTRASEGAFVYQNGKYFYLFWSSGQCCNLDTSKPAAGDEYKIMVCRATDVKGPYTDKDGKNCATGNGGTLLLASHDNVYAPGGEGVFNDKTRGPVMYYHYLDTNVGLADGQSIFGWNSLKFDNDWPVLQ